MDRTAWDQRYSGRELVWTSEANRFLVEEAAALAPARALDLACREGRNSVWLAERGWRVTGVDFSAVGLAKAAQLAEGRGIGAKWIAADLVDYQPEPRGFELVIVFYLQVPAPQRTSIVRGAAGALALDGVLLLVGHDRSNIEQGYGGPQDPTVLYTAEDVVADLSGTGMRIERAERVERPVKTSDGLRRALDVLVRARAIPLAHLPEIS